MLKKKIGLAMATTALGATLVAGGSFALFTDSAANTGNTFAAGTVNIALDREDGGTAAEYFDMEKMAPGDTEIQKVKVSNVGTLDLRFDLVLADAGDLAPVIALEAFSDADATNPLPLNGHVLAPEAEKVIYVKATFDRNADNWYQGRTGTGSITVNAVQTANNP